jgi:hypothetical protein
MDWYTRDFGRFTTESIATLPPFSDFSPIEGQKWFDQISSQWESQKNRFALIYFGKIQFLPPCIWNLPFMSAASAEWVTEMYGFAIWRKIKAMSVPKLARDLGMCGIRLLPQFLNFDFDTVPKMIRIRNTSFFINQNVQVELDPISIHVERCRQWINWLPVNTWQRAND